MCHVTIFLDRESHEIRCLILRFRMSCRIYSVSDVKRPQCFELVLDTVLDSCALFLLKIHLYGF